MKNRYLKRAHISNKKFRQILSYFCLDYTATITAKTTGISRITINRFYALFRKRILELVQSDKIGGEIEIDESYFGARRVRGKRGRGAKGKTPVVGLLKRNGKVYTEIVRNCQIKELLPIIKGRILTKSTIYTDGWKSYDGLVLNGYKHYRIYHHKNEFARGKNHINGIESFWSYAKRRLHKFNGIRKNMFILHLKESEFRWNNRKDLYQKLIVNFREKPL